MRRVLLSLAVFSEAKTIKSGLEQIPLEPEQLQSSPKVLHQGV
jgi:hypothetical protein